MGSCPFDGSECDKIKPFFVTIANANGIIKNYQCCTNCPQLEKDEFDSILETIDGENVFDKIKNIKEKKCTCGTRLADILNGEIGCANCYKIFKEEMEDSIKRYHGGEIKHVGKRPKNLDKYKKEVEEKPLDINKLWKSTVNPERVNHAKYLANLRMNNAVKVEHYEKAAEMKNIINQLHDIEKVFDKKRVRKTEKERILNELKDIEIKLS